MSLGDDLLHAIAAAPNDPAARLVYADHRLGLSANDAHAELIVVQERLAELDATGLWRDAFSQEAENLRDRAKAIIATLEAHLDLPTRLATWRRGFIERLSLNVATPANLAKRIEHPAFCVVRALHFQDPDLHLAPIAPRLKPTVHRVEGSFRSSHLEELGPIIDEARVDIAMATTATRIIPRLERLELTEREFVVPDELQRELAWGYLAARRTRDEMAEEFAAIERSRLTSSFDKLPLARHLVLETSAPLEPSILAALSKYSGRSRLASVRLHASHNAAPKALIGLGAPFKEVHFEALRDPDREVAARGEANLGEVCLHFGHAAEAAHHFDDAFCFSEGKYPGVAARFEDASKAAGSKRQLTDPDPVRDGLLHRVPALMRWGQIDRVLAAAPQHRGAWAIKGLRHRDDYELDDAEEAFAQALADDPDAAMLAKAYALMLEDPPEALAVLNHVEPRAHANVLFACIHALQSRPEIALGLLRDSSDALARLATGLLERQCGQGLRAREIWNELIRVPDGNQDPARWVITFFAATLGANEPYHKRRAFHDWLTTAEPRRPAAALVFDPLIRVGNKVMPQVDLTMVSREVDRLRGA